ncbi:Signal peptidase I-like protein [Halorubrum kocurii]|uniref:Signal peptidase I-like protein n=1 Tax=Halorubrum kocurii JCM 14978 TaxID=1230456 RepID=M0PEQ8_9EURY|nr:Signal peptidase I-like protein [Halorubrum kocurii]EMA68501.1 Signal peptidase I-like protein [Halorubrum kocurii JCM 14978]
MDEGDRSDGDDESDRETGSADIDAGSGDPDGEDVDSADTDSDGLAGDAPGDGADRDDGSITEESDGWSGEVADDTESETGSPGVAEASGEPDRPVGGPHSSDRASDDRPIGDRRADSPSGTERDRTDADRPGAETDRGPDASGTGFLYRFRHDRDGILMWIREMLSSVAIVLVIGLILFGVSGVWPPMVAVESGSMEPNMEVGDLVFVTEPGRLAPDAADNDIGVVTHEAGEAADYRTFGSYGSVVIYRPPGRTASPIIHRAMFHVEEGENWYDRADDRYHNAAGCGELTHCPAPHDGFITLGDNNAEYDQASGLAAPVRADWVTGVARVRVPYLGYVRLIATGQAEPGDVLATGVAVGTGWSTLDSGTGERTPVTMADAADTKPTVSSGDAPARAAG